LVGLAVAAARLRLTVPGRRAVGSLAGLPSLAAAAARLGLAISFAWLGVAVSRIAG
jgi:hypothetical protein